jgi:hypothetical protein
MGFSTFVAFNRLHRSPELWLQIALASLRLALAFDRRGAATREDRLLQQAAANAAVARAARIAAIDRLRAGLAAAWSQLSLARPSPRPVAPVSTPSS